MPFQDPYLCAILKEQAGLKAKEQLGKLGKLSGHATDVIKRKLFSVQHTVEIVSEKGASSWLSALPIETHKFDLSKHPFVTLCVSVMAGPFLTSY